MRKYSIQTIVFIFVFLLSMFAYSDNSSPPSKNKKVSKDITNTKKNPPKTPQYKIYISLTGSGGHVNCAPKEGDLGSSSTCMIVTDDGYTLTTLIDNGEDVISKVANSKYMIKDLKSNHALNATFISPTGIVWNQFKDIEAYTDFILSRINNKNYTTYRYAWTDIENAVRDMVQKEKNQQAEKFKQLREEHYKLGSLKYALDRDKNAILLLLERQNNLSLDIKALEATRNSLKEMFFKSIKDIGYVELIKTCSKDIPIGDLLEGKKKEILDKLDGNIAHCIERNPNYKKIWIEHHVTTRNGILAKDIVIQHQGVTYSDYPLSRGAIHDFNISKNRDSQVVCLIKAVQFFPNFINDPEPLKEMGVGSNNKMGDTDCISMRSDTEVKRNLSSDENVKILGETLTAINKSNDLQSEQLKNLTRDYESQISQLDLEIRKIYSELNSIKDEIAKIVIKPEYSEIVPLKSINGIENAKDGFVNALYEITSKKGKVEERINELASKNASMVYSYKRITLPEDIKNPKQYFINKLKEELSNSEESSDFETLIKRLEQNRSYYVTVVTNGQLTSRKGYDYYIKPTLNHIKEFALVGPEALTLENFKVMLNYILVIRGVLTKMSCPVGPLANGIFDTEPYNESSRMCSPCQLPTLEQLEKMPALPEGVYWSRDTDGIMIKSFIKGSNIYAQYADSPLVRETFFPLVSGKSGYLLQPKTGAAQFFCIGD